MEIQGGWKVKGEKGIIFSYKVMKDKRGDDCLIFLANWDIMTDDEKKKTKNVIEKLKKEMMKIGRPLFDLDQILKEARAVGDYSGVYAYDLVSGEVKTVSIKIVTE